MLKKIAYNNSKLHFLKKLCLLFLLFFLFQNTGDKLFAQTTTDLEQFGHLFESNTEKIKYKSFLKGNSNELELLSSAFFVFYKDFFSSQDGNHCVFYPSCSVYSIQAIKEQGLIIGTMNGIDRLSRCNRLSPENYKTYKNTNLFYDPLD